METVLQIFFYAVIAAASALAFASTLTVLKSRRGRLNGLIFAVAFLVGETVVWVVALALGAATSLNSGDQGAVAVFKLILGVLMFAAASRVRRGGVPRYRASGERTRTLLARLERLTPTVAFVVGALLGIGGPKRLTIALVAATTLSVSGLSTNEQALLVVLYVLVAGVLVWAPVAFYLIAGRRATDWLAKAQEWLKSKQQALTYYGLLAFGGVLVVNALIELL